MHQNLRTSFTLNEELLTFKKQDDQETKLQKQQLLIPAMQYGTFFNIYAKFDGELIKDKFVPKSCDVFLQNYQGNVTIGLVKIEPEIDIIFDKELDEPVYILKVHLKALHAKYKFNEPQDVAVSTKPLIMKYKDNTDWTGILRGNNEIDCKYLLRVLLIYDNLSTDIFNPKENVNNSKFINSFRYERDGDQLLEKKFEIVGKTGVPLGFGNDDYSIDEKKGTITTYRCKPQYVQFRLQ